MWAQKHKNAGVGIGMRLLVGPSEGCLGKIKVLILDYWLLIIHNSQLTVHNSQFTIHNPRSKIQDPRSKIQDPRSKIQDPRSRSKNPESKRSGERLLDAKEGFDLWRVESEFPMFGKVRWSQQMFLWIRMMFCSHLAYPKPHFVYTSNSSDIEFSKIFNEIGSKIL